jgi:hypothetical protein
LDPVQIAAPPSASAIATAATLNVVRIAAGRRSAVRTSTRMIRDGKCGRVGGRAKKIANAWTSTTAVTQIFPISIACSPTAFGMLIRGVGSGNSERPLLNFARFAQVLLAWAFATRAAVVGRVAAKNKRRAVRWRKSKARQRWQ